MKSCFFIGHRDAPQSIKEKLEATIERIIHENGEMEFIVGNHGNFDRYAQSALSSAKKKYSGIKLLLLTAYHPATRQIELPEGFDYVYYPPGMERIPPKLAIVRANRYIVKNVDILIAFVWHPGSSARDLLEYARSQQKDGSIHIYNIADEFEEYKIQ